MSPLKRFQVLLKPDHITALRAIEQRTGTSMGSLIRLALDEWLTKSGDMRTGRRPRRNATVSPKTR